MAGVDPQLVRQIAQQVMAALAKTEAGSAPTPRAQIHPPAGTCTGDYSKFVELAGKMPAGSGNGSKSAPPQAKPTPATAGKPQDATGPVLFGFITAKQLENLTGTVRLAAGAKLTPLARDIVKERKLQIEHVAIGGASGSAADAAPASDWLWWIDGHCPVAEQVMQERRGTFKGIATRRQPSALAEAVRQIARQVNENRAAGAVLFVHAGAAAGCFANRCACLRALVGTSDRAVEQGVQTLGANVLIVEYPMHGHRSMRSLIERFVDTPRKPLPSVDAQLRELGSCV